MPIDLLATRNGNADQAPLPPPASSNATWAKRVADSEFVSDVNSYSPPWKFVIFGRWVGNPIAYSLTWTGLPTIAARRYTPKLRAHRDQIDNGPDGPEGWHLLIEARPAGGAWTVLRTLTADDVPLDAWQQLIATTYVATSATSEFRLRTFYAGVQVTNVWMLDDVELWEEDEAEMVLREITAAVVEDLESVTALNSYATDVKEVTTEPKDIMLLRTPGIVLRAFGAGDAEEETIGNRRRSAIQRYAAGLVIISNDPDGAIHDFLDDVSNAIEKSTSNVMTQAGTNYTVESAKVTDWSPVQASKDLTNYKARMALVIEVGFIYTPGLR